MTTSMIKGDPNYKGTIKLGKPSKRMSVLNKYKTRKQIFNSPAPSIQGDPKGKDYTMTEKIKLFS